MEGGIDILGTEVRDRIVYVRLPAEAGEYAGRVLLLLKSIYGLKTSDREFVQQISEQTLSFTSVAATTDRKLREAFFDHIRKKWVITHVLD
jgi:hypothetical protein